MYWFNCRVTIGNLKPSPTFSEVEISSSWKSIGDTATLKLPGLRHKLEKLITTGQPVKIEMGYNGQLNTVFEVFVADVLPNVPFELKLEDEAYWLKRRLVTKAWKKTTLREVLAYLYTGPLDNQVPDVDLSPFRLDQVSIYKALEKLKEEFGLTIYFRGKTLYAGLAYAEQAGTATVVYHLQRNVVSTELTFKRADDVRLGVKAVSILADAKDLRVHVGDDDGDQVTIHFYNVTSEAKLKQLATERLDKLKYEGYRGSITGYGLPRPVHGQAVQLLDELYPERAMKVLVDGVNTSASKSGGFRRVVTLGRRAS